MNENIHVMHPNPAYMGSRPTFGRQEAVPISPHPHHHPHAHGFCHSCCHPLSMCICGHRSCRKEAKELLVTPSDRSEDKLRGMVVEHRSIYPFLTDLSNYESGTAAERLKEDVDADKKEANFTQLLDPNKVIAQLVQKGAYGRETTFIGGGCCVHLSVEYMPSPMKLLGGVYLAVLDSEYSFLIWGKIITVATNYQIKECVISTKPGANLLAFVYNTTARVRWCEVFSC